MRGAATASIWLAAAVALAACGHAAATVTRTNAAVDAATQYAQCMRANGVPDFPDPDANGQLRGPGHEQQNDPNFQAAAQKCRTLVPASQHENTGDPAFVEQMRRYSQCIRSNGVPDFPDPDANGQLRGAGHELQGDPKFQAAAQKCLSSLPGGGGH